MAFFPRTFYNTTADTASFTPLFRLLDDFDSYSRQSSCGQQNAGRAVAVRQWTPKFDVRETAGAYELHGELAGVNKDNVQIEFTEPQSLLVRGKVERTYTAGTHPSAQLEDTSSTSATTEADETKSNSSHQATVEDEFEDVSHGSATEEVAEPEKPVEEPKKQSIDNAKYWLTERSIGEFSRTFNFPSRVDQDNVTARFNDGILSITVPKAKKHESRRIAVF